MKRLLKLSGIVIVSIVGIFLLLGLLPDNDKIPQGFSGKLIDIDGNNIRIVQEGSGPDVLFIHGLPAMLEVFNPLKKYLSASCRLTLYDRPANGFSSATNSQYSVEYNAQMALEIIKKLQLKNVVVVGHSYGGPVALAMALKDTVNIKALVVLGSTCMYYGEPAKKSILGDLFSVPILGRGVAFVFGKTVGKKIMEKTLKQAIAPSNEKLISDLITNAQTYWTTPKVLIDYVKEKRDSPLSRKRMMHEYKNIKAKVVFVHGLKDQLTPAKNAIDASKLIENSSLVLLNDDGHFIQYAKPKEIAQIILNEAQ